jgi:hypothetical protein
LSDIDGNGTQFNQSEACSEETALNLALSSSVLADCNRFSNLFLHKGMSQAAWTDFKMGKSSPLSRFDHWKVA